MKFPLIEKWLGLKVEEALFFATKLWVVRADDLEAAIEKGEELYSWGKGNPSGAIPRNQGYCTHTGLYIGQRLIEKPDTAEILLRELIAADGASAIHAAKIIDRAKALLEADRLAKGT